MQTQWFVIHTLAGQEQRVKESIEKRLKAEEMGEYIKEVLVPMEKVAEVRNGKKTVTMRKLHPGYVYIDMSLLDESRRVLEKPWYFIRETQGIIGFVGGERPVPVRLLGHEPQRPRVLLVPQPGRHVGRLVGLGADRAVLGAHRRPAALGLHPPEGRLRPRLLDPEPRAVGDLVEAVAKRLRPDPDGLEEDVVLRVARHTL